MLSNIANRIFPSEADALRPRLACEITSAGVVAGRPGEAEQEIVSSFAPLRAGVLAAGLKTPNFSDRAAVAAALRQALDEISVKESQVTVVIPDAAVRVLLLDFDVLPSKLSEALPIIRFRLRKLVPFEVEDAAVSYQVMPGKPDSVRVIVAVSPAAVVAEYESAVREAGYEPGVVLPSTLAALAAVSSEEPALVINRNGSSVTTAVAKLRAGRSGRADPSAGRGENPHPRPGAHAVQKQGHAWRHPGRGGGSAGQLNAGPTQSRFPSVCRAGAA